MDVILELEGGNSFSVEVYPLETVLDVKEKVQQSHNIPISHQTLFFNGQLLQDNLQLWGTSIDDGSRILLLVAAPNLPPPPQPPAVPVPVPEQPLPTLPSFQHDPFAMLPAFPPSSLQPIPMPYDYDPFSMSEFSSSMQFTHMPSDINELDALLASIDIPPPPPPPSPPQPLPPPRVTLMVKVPKLKDRVPIQMDLDDTVLKLKKKILAHEDMQGVPVDRIVLKSKSTRVEYLDHQVLKDCAVSENDEIDLFLKPSLPVAGSRRTSRSGKLMVTVLPMRTDKKIVIEVNATDKVSVLKEELEKLRQTLQFRLPENGAYFFIHRQSVMYEDKSFLYHQVRDGETIETFDGIVFNPPSTV